MLHNASFMDVGSKFLLLILYCVVLGVCAFWAYYLSKDSRFYSFFGGSIGKIVRRKKKNRLSESDFLDVKNK